MSAKTVYQLDEDGFLTGTTSADESPLEPGVFLLPRGCVDIAPLSHVDGKRQKFEDGKFIYIDIPQPEPAPEPTAAEIAAQTNAAILSQIIAIEHGSQPRAIREAVLGMAGAADRLATLDAQIAALRAQLIR